MFELLKSTAYDLLPGTWQMFLGTALLLTILFLPEGIGSLVRPAAAAAGLDIRRHRAMTAIETAILTVRDLEKRFGSVVAARDINVAVAAAAEPSASSAPTAPARPPSST